MTKGQESPCLTAALEYLASGWSAICLCPPDHSGCGESHLMTCKSPGKAPIRSWKDAQVRKLTEKEIRRHWDQYPSANVGVVMGRVSGLVGIDIDGPEGREWIKQNQADLPATRMFETPNGGMRYLYRHPIEDVYTHKFCLPGSRKEAVRILGKGSQTVMPPSHLVLGVDTDGLQETRPYHWLNQGFAIPEFPLWWLWKAAEIEKQPKLILPQSPQPQSSARLDSLERARRYARTCNPSISGQGGHNQAILVADKIAVGFDLGDHDTFTVLEQEWNPRCQPPWNMTELLHKITEARKCSPHRPGYLRDQQREPQPVLNPPKGGTGAVPARKEKVPPQAMVKTFDQIERKQVEYLWGTPQSAYFPLKLVVLDGDPGLGKSTLLCDLVARTSRSGIMPDMTQGVCGHVMILSAEDSDEDTILPRLLAAGAVRERVHIFQGLVDESGERDISIPDDVEWIEKALIKHDCRLLIIDPLMAYLAGDSAKDNEVRRAMRRLKKLAEKCRCCIIALRHLNKGSSSNPLYRGGGSIGIIAAARAGLIVARDPDSPEEGRVLAVNKMNCGKAGPSLKFRLEEVPEVEACRISWGGVCQHSTAKLLDQPKTAEEADQQAQAKTKLRQACDLIRELLRPGPQAIADVKRQAVAAGLSHATAERASRLLKVVVTNFDPRRERQHTWALPTVVDEETPIPD